MIDRRVAAFLALALGTACTEEDTGGGDAVAPGAAEGEGEGPAQPPESPVPESLPPFDCSTVDLEALGFAAPEGSASVACIDDFVPEGALALGPAIRIGPGGGRFDPEVALILPLVPDRSPVQMGIEHIRIYWRPVGHDRLHTPPFPDVHPDLEAGVVSLRTPVFGDFQVGVARRDLLPRTRRWAFRSIVGVSMGAGGASMVGIRHPEEFDQIVAMGGTFDWGYLLKYIHDHGMGGFCSGDAVGQLCEAPPTTEQFEHGQTYERWHYSDNGGSFDRDEYLTIFQDLSMAFGNLTSYNPDSAYLPAGVPNAELMRSNQDRCSGRIGATFTIESGYYDDEYNPDGSLPVIMFCDAETDNHPCTSADECRSGICKGSGGRGRCRPTGWYDDAGAHNRPVEVAVAVDVNNNHRRDSGEPIIRSTHEPYDDVGPDGLPSAEEPGYHPTDNPDPSDDDYNWFTNPFGTEGNWEFDEGEPYRDFGLDGVEGTADSPYDHGEGNGRHDDSPNRTRMLDWNPRKVLQAASGEMLEHTSIYLDAGIRDLFNLAPSASQFAGMVAAKGGNLRLYDNFHSLGNVESEAYFDPFTLDFPSLGDHLFVRYGKRDASPAEILDGEGGHVGTFTDAFLRFMTMLGWVTNSFPEGDYEIVEPDARTDLMSFHSEALGGEYRYSVVLPPGYSDPDNVDKRYPVVYLLHGYGMTPEDLQLTVQPFGGIMAEGFWQKVILVYPDGFCGETRVTQCSDGIDNDGDGALDHDDGRREACREDGTCRRVGYSCREGLCCQEGWADCGLPDPDCRGDRDTNESPGDDLPICADGVDNDQDGFVDHPEDRGCVEAASPTEADCRKGTFYVDHAAWPDGSSPGPAFAGAMIDLLHHVDQTYRTKAPKELPRGRSQHTQKAP